MQEEVAKANDDSNAFSKQVLKEFETFQETKTLELKQGLLAYADCHIEFYEKVNIYTFNLAYINSCYRVWQFGKGLYPY